MSELRLEPEGRLPQAVAPAAAPLVPPLDPEEFSRPVALRDQPPWVRDGLAVSQRARALIACLRPVVVAACASWEQALRAITVAGRVLRVDAAGCYRADSP